MTQKSDNPAPHAGEREPGRVQDGQAVPSDGSPTSGHGTRVVRPESEKHTGQAPPEDMGDDRAPGQTTRGDKGGTG